MNKRQKTSAGAVTVEFALVVPILVMLVFGVTELGRALYQLNTLTKSTLSGARYLARLSDAVDYDKEAGTCSKGEAWSSSNIEKAKNLVLYGDEVSGGEMLLPNMSVTFDVIYSDVSDGSSTSAGCVITASSEAAYTSVFGDEGPMIPFTDIDSFNMSQEVQERYIGE